MNEPFTCPSIKGSHQYMLRLLERLLPGRHTSDGYYCVLRFPDSTENRWFSELPTPGARIHSYGGFGELWIVDEVLQSGRNTYTAFLVGRDEYLEHLRRNSPNRDLGEELLELARHTASTVSEQRRRFRRRRHYWP